MSPPKAQRRLSLPLVQAAATIVTAPGDGTMPVSPSNAVRAARSTAAAQMELAAALLNGPTVAPRRLSSLDTAAMSAAGADASAAAVSGTSASDAAWPTSPSSHGAHAGSSSWRSPGPGPVSTKMTLTVGSNSPDRAPAVPFSPLRSTRKLQPLSSFDVEPWRSDDVDSLMPSLTTVHLSASKVAVGCIVPLMPDSDASSPTAARALRASGDHANAYSHAHAHAHAHGHAPQREREAHRHVTAGRVGTGTSAGVVAGTVTGTSTGSSRAGARQHDRGAGHGHRDGEASLSVVAPVHADGPDGADTAAGPFAHKLLPSTFKAVPLKGSGSTRKSMPLSRVPSATLISLTPLHRPLLPAGGALK
jgi:hypothetical protein